MTVGELREGLAHYPSKAEVATDDALGNIYLYILGQDNDRIIGKVVLEWKNPNG